MALCNLYMKPFTCHVRKKFLRAHGYVDDPLPNIVHYMLFGCQRALYVHQDRLCGVFGQFFSASCVVSLKKVN